MEIQIKPTRTPVRTHPAPDPLELYVENRLAFFHTGCGGRVSIDEKDHFDDDAYATVRCNLCFETQRERRGVIVTAINEVLRTGEPSGRSMVLRFVHLSTREILVHSPLASRLQQFLRRHQKPHR